MSFERYDVYFAGKILPGQDLEAVRERIGKLFRADGKKLDRLFQGTPIRIKADVDMDKAIRYRVMFRDAGALIDIRPVVEKTATDDVTDAPAAKKPRLSAPESMPDFELLPAATGSLEDCATPVEATALPDITSLKLDAPGTRISDAPEPTPADIDTSGLSALPANTGSLEAFKEEKEAAKIPDISALKLED